MTQLITRASQMHPRLSSNLSIRRARIDWKMIWEREREREREKRSREKERNQKEPRITEMKMCRKLTRIRACGDAAEVLRYPLSRWIADSHFSALLSVWETGGIRRIRRPCLRPVHKVNGKLTDSIMFLITLQRSRWSWWCDGPTCSW